MQDISEEVSPEAFEGTDITSTYTSRQPAISIGSDRKIITNQADIWLPAGALEVVGVFSLLLGTRVQVNKKRNVLLASGMFTPDEQLNFQSIQPQKILQEVIGKHEGMTVVGWIRDAGSSSEITLHDKEIQASLQKIVPDAFGCIGNREGQPTCFALRNNKEAPVADLEIVDVEAAARWRVM